MTSSTDDADDLRVRAQRVRARAYALEAELDLADSLMALVLAAYDKADHMEQLARSQRAVPLEVSTGDGAP